MNVGSFLAVDRGAASLFAQHGTVKTCDCNRIAEVDNDCAA